MPTSPDPWLDDTLIDNEIDLSPPQSVPMPAGAGAATMPTMSSTVPPRSPMDSMITDFLISKFGGGGVQGANAPAPIEPPMPPPRTGSANAAPMAPPTPMQGAPAPPLTMGDLTKRGALQQYLPDVINAFLPTAEPPPRGASGSANANPGASAGAIPPSLTPPPRTGSANAAPLAASPPMPPSMPPPRTGSANAAPMMQPGAVPPPPAASVDRSVAAIENANTEPTVQEQPTRSWKDIIRSALVPRGSGLDLLLGDRTASGRGSANAHPGDSTTYPPKDTGATGDEFAARRQQSRVGPPNTQSLPKGASTRYSRPYAKGGVKEGQKRPMPRAAPRASAGRSVSKSVSRPPQQSQQQQMKSRNASATPQRQGQAPQTARGGRSAFAQSLIDSMGPRGEGVTTYIEPATGNEILTGNGIYRNLGKTSTGTQKPAFTKYFNG